MADPSSCLVQDFTDGVLNPALATHISHDGKVGPVWRPISPLYVFKYFSRSASSKRYAAKCPLVDVRIHIMTTKQDRHLAFGGNREDLGFGQPKRTRLWTLRPRGIEFDRVALPRCAVHDRFPVWRETCHANCSASECELVIYRRNDAGGKTLALTFPVRCTD